MTSEYRGFLVECAAESQGEAVYPLWRDLPDGDQPPVPRCGERMMHGGICGRPAGHKREHRVLRRERHA